MLYEERKMRKYRKKRFRKLKGLSGILAALLLAVFGYEVKTTGSIAEAFASMEILGEELLDFTEQELSVGELLDKAQEVISRGASSRTVSLDEIPEYSGSPYVVINGNIPIFTEEELAREPFEYYSSLDSLGRCGYAEAMIDMSLMPTEKREAIGSVKPSGWRTAKYNCVDGKYLYNRCHLIGYQLTGENANERNLITGTRYLNIEGMLPFENMVADYVKETGDKVLYRVTPVFEGHDLVAGGVQMEAQSINSDEICFNVYAYNVQPQITIDYRTGESSLD